MNGCEIIPTGSKSEFSDNDAVIPTVSRVLGCGAYGVVFLTGGKARARAIKFQPYGENSAAREIKMCHAFNKVAVEGATRVFTKTFRWYAVTRCSSDLVFCHSRCPGIKTPQQTD